MRSPDAALQNLVDQAADQILFGDAMVELPAALGALVIDIAAACVIRDLRLVERHLIREFSSRLDLRLRAAIEDDLAAKRWRGLLHGLERNFPTCH
jgi:hypothetical protein